MTIFKLPDLGEGLPDAEIREWHVAVGDKVKTDQPIVSMETAKAVVEVPAPYAGEIKTLFGEVGDIIDTGASLVEFIKDNESATPQTEERADTGTVAGNIEVGTEVIEETAIVLTRKRGSNAHSRPVLPAVRDLATKLGVDLTKLAGSGRNGMVTIKDVQQAGSSSSATATPAQPASAKQSGNDLPNGEALHGSRRIMAQTMAKSHAEVVPVSIFDRAVLSAWGEKVDITGRLIRAIVAACKAEPALNAAFSGSSLRRQLQDEVHLGLAMDTAEGLFVPVLRDVDSKLSDLSKLRQRLDAVKQQMQDRSIAQEDLQGATITLSNFGVFAGKHATPVVVQPQVAIIACGKLHEAVVAENGKAVVAKVMPLSITFDHRAVTGGEATRFMSVLLADLQQAE